MRWLLLTCSLALAACGGKVEVALGESSSSSGGGGGGGGAPDCATLDVCACQKAPACQASFDGCHCPSDFGCDPEVVCACGGGAFLGCSAK